MGPLACLLSAAAFSVMAILAKLAYADGVGVHELLLVRFGLAAAVLLAVAAASGRFARMPRRIVVTGLLMGGIGYTLQAGLFFTALTHVDAATVTLLYSTYPLWVMGAAVLLGRDRLTAPRVVALVMVLAGVALVLGKAGRFDLLGWAMAFGSALVYTCYILVGHRVRGVDPVAFAAVVCSGAILSLAAQSVVTGAPDLGFAARGWLWLGILALVCTVGAIILFFHGLARVGPTGAALLSSIEPVLTVGWAALVFGEMLTRQQLVGAALVLGAVVLVQVPVRMPRRESVRGPARESVRESAPATETGVAPVVTAAATCEA